MTTPRHKAISVHIDNEADRERIVYWAHQEGAAPVEFLEQLIHRAARLLLDPVPITVPRGPRPLSEVRAQAKARALGDSSPYTASIPTQKAKP